MRRRETVVVTVAAGGIALACGGAPDVIMNPPPPPPPVDTPWPAVTPVVEGTLPDTPLPADPAPYERMGHQPNHRHPERGAVYRSPAGCYVHMPFQTPPTSFVPPPTAAVGCPEEMASFAWTQCFHGTMYADPKGEACICSVDGNPPPPPRWIHCPTDETP